MQDHVYARLELLDEMKISIQSKEAARKSSPLRWYGVRVVGWMIALALQALCVFCIIFILKDNGPSFFRLVLGLPHVTLVKLKAFVSYQNYHMLLLRRPVRRRGRQPEHQAAARDIPGHHAHPLPREADLQDRAA